MDTCRDLFEPVDIEQESEPLSLLTRRPVALTANEASTGLATARLHGFSLDDRPLVTGIRELPHEVVVARTTVALLNAHVGSTVIVMFESGDVRRPIIMGVVQDHSPQPTRTPEPPAADLVLDNQRLVLTAEREIVLRCGNASITLTRAGKVLIKGAYILSRSSGYNKVKGAAVDIN
jgi:hypothetical protein